MLESLKRAFGIDIKTIQYADDDFVIVNDDTVLILGEKIKTYNFDDICKQISKYKNKITKLYIGKIDFKENLNIDLNQSLNNIKEINFKYCNFFDIKIYNPQNIKVKLKHISCETISVQNSEDVNNDDVSFEFNDVLVKKNLILDINKISNFISKNLEIKSNAYFKSDFINKLILEDTLFNGIVSFSNSSFKKIPYLLRVAFKETKQVHFDYTGLEHIDKATIENQVNNSIKNDYNKKNYDEIIKNLIIKKQNASDLQSSLRLLKDIAITKNNKIYAKECEKLELFAYEIYLKTKRDIKSKELTKNIDSKNQSKQKNTNRQKASAFMWKATLEHFLIKFNEITSEHHTNLSKIIFFTLSIIFSLYLELFVVKIFSFLNIDFNNTISSTNNYCLLANVFVLLLFGLCFCISKNPISKFICFILIILISAFVIYPNYLVLTYFGILIVILCAFYFDKKFIYGFISLYTLFFMICIPIFSENITTTPNIYYLDNTLNVYTQQEIKEALAIASVNAKQSSSFVSKKIFSPTLKNAKNSQNIRQYIKDNRLSIYYADTKTKNKIYNEIIKAIWIDSQLNVIFFIFFTIIVLCLYSLQKTYRKI